MEQMRRGTRKRGAASGWLRSAVDGRQDAVQVKEESRQPDKDKGQKGGGGRQMYVGAGGRIRSTWSRGGKGYGAVPHIRYRGSLTRRHSRVRASEAGLPQVNGVLGLLVTDLCLVLAVPGPMARPQGADCMGRPTLVSGTPELGMDRTGGRSLNPAPWCLGWGLVWKREDKANSQAAG